MGSVEVVEVLPLLELVVEQIGVIDDDAVDATVDDMPVERSLELRAVIGLGDLDFEGELLQDVVEELDGRLLVVALVDPQGPDAGAVVDRCVLVVALWAFAGVDGLVRGSMNFTSTWTRWPGSCFS